MDGQHIDDADYKCVKCGSVMKIEPNSKNKDGIILYCKKCKIHKPVWFKK